MNRTNVDYRKLVGNSQVVMLGESHHFYPEYQDEVASSLRELKILGYTHFAMEMLQTDQNLNKPKTIINELSDAFTPNHAKVYKQAKLLGFKIVGLDMPLAQQGQFNAKKLYKARNQWMVDSVMKTLKQGRKVVVFVHHGHAMGSTGSMKVPDDYGMRSLLKRKKVSTVYIQVAGGHLDDSCSRRSSPVSNQAQKDAVHNSRFVSNGGLGIDYVVHLPQNCVLK